MKWLAGLAFLLLPPVLQAAPPHLDLDVTLDPQTRHFRAVADLTSAGRLDPSLDPLFRVSRITVNGVNVPAGRLPQLDAKRLPPPRGKRAAPQRLRMEYSGTLPALPQAEQRNSPDPAVLFASADGSYLSAGAGWYPDPGVAFTYRVKLTVPAGQKALAPGRQVRQSDGAGRYVAEYDFPHPAEGIWVMAGPYQVQQQTVRLEDGKPVTVRTWFHPELSALAGGYLQDSAGYIQRYSRLIGSYPFGDFSVVSSPLSHGVGMPSLTYLGRQVLRLPFIRATSLGHEVLHNWWGNGVYPEWLRGNWSEGLTTFMADYAFREDQSEEAAREMRMSWLRDLAAVAPADETSLLDFKSRRHGISSVIGYGKAAMVFFMLRDEIGRPAFERGVRLFWQGYRFRSANWQDIEKVFARASGRDLSAFFTQWTTRAASPRLSLADGTNGQPGRFKLVQVGEPFELLVPLRIRTAAGESHETKLHVRDGITEVDPVSAALPPAVKVELDPELRLWRRLDPQAVPPIFREVFISPRAQLFVANQGAEWNGAAVALAEQVLDAQPRRISQDELLVAPEVPVLAMGDRASIARLLPVLGLGALPDVLSESRPGQAGGPSLKGNAQAWTARAGNGKTIAFVMAESPGTLASLQRAMPHYGRQSWLIFQEGKVVGQGAWPLAAQSLSLK